MRGLVERYIDYQAAKTGKPTFEQELEESNLRATIQTGQVGLLAATAASAMTAIGVVGSLDSEVMELDGLTSSSFTREAIESTIVFGMKVPFVFMALGGAAVAAEGFNIWRRARNHRRELEQPGEDKV